MEASTLAVDSLYTAEAGFQVVVVEPLTRSVAITAPNRWDYLTNSSVLPFYEEYLLCPNLLLYKHLELPMATPFDLAC